MNAKSSPKNPDDLKSRIKKLVSFEEGKGLSGPSRKSPKYARVLTCTFVKGAGDPTHRQKKEPKIVYFPDLTTKEEASIK
ncbi:MAG: hypothetical protein JSV10_10060 [Candidatus Zixiibacteriota bacterium]|nr:MAG: hypothetical protein JSV10_10060 [candidate division Zixibacteria bacterium]